MRFGCRSMVARSMKRMRKTKVFTIDQMRAKNGKFVDEINDFMQGYRVLCVSKLKDSERMWERYAQNNEGVVLRITPNTEKDSKFQLFRKVEYQDTRAPNVDHRAGPAVPAVL